MKKGIIISIGLIVLGSIFECLHFASDHDFLEIKLWLLGVICITLGVLGLIWNIIIPLLENRAKKIGKVKKEYRIKNNNPQ